MTPTSSQHGDDFGVLTFCVAVLQTAPRLQRRLAPEQVLEVLGSISNLYLEVLHDRRERSLVCETSDAFTSPWVSWSEILAEARNATGLRSEPIRSLLILAMASIIRAHVYAESITSATRIPSFSLPGGFTWHRGNNSSHVELTYRDPAAEAYDRYLLLSRPKLPDAHATTLITISSLLREVSPEAGAKGVEILLADDVGRLPLTDMPLRRAFRNLLRLALSSAERGSTISIRRAADGLSFVLTTMPDADLQRIFEPFYSTAESRPEGRGFGLAIARRIVESLGGQMRPVPVPGTSAFELTLPLSRT